MQKITQIHQKYIFLDFLKQVRKKSLKFWQYNFFSISVANQATLLSLWLYDLE